MTDGSSENTFKVAAELPEGAGWNKLTVYRDSVYLVREELIVILEPDSIGNSNALALDFLMDLMICFWEN